MCPGSNVSPPRPSNFLHQQRHRQPLHRRRIDLGAKAHTTRSLGSTCPTLATQAPHTGDVMWVTPGRLLLPLGVAGILPREACACSRLSGS